MDGREPQLASAVAAAATTEIVRIGRGCLDGLPGVADAIAPGLPCAVVADANTWRAAGARAADTLAWAGATLVEPVVLGGEPRVKPDVETARQLASRWRAERALPVAVGSGVINDLVKHAAELARVPYVSVPTAASMDGYAASGAALRENGFKRTFACAGPAAIVADLDVIVRAPAEMAAWGYGDLLGKLVAGADWVIADALGEEALNPTPFAMVQDNLLRWLLDPAGVRCGDTGAIDDLMRGLVMSGLAMQAHGNSRPASGSDHQFAHLWEMEELAVDGQPVSHGACVGVGCLSMLAAFEWLVRQDISGIDPAQLAARADAGHPDAASLFPISFMAANAEIEMAAKATSPMAVERRLRALKSNWPAIAAWLRERLPRAAIVRQWLDAAGAPSSAAAIGVSVEKHAWDYARARMIRRRYTGLDLLRDLGWLDAAVGDLFGVGGFWGPSRAVA
jgi:glycerol-1-phosphate dehydrogenase [NAD(P)+]